MHLVLEGMYTLNAKPHIASDIVSTQAYVYDAAYQMYAGAGGASAAPPMNVPGATVGAEDATVAASAFPAIPPELAFQQFAQGGGIPSGSEGLMYIATPNGFAAVPPPPNAAALMRRMSRPVQVFLLACGVSALHVTSCSINQLQFRCDLGYACCSGPGRCEQLPISSRGPAAKHLLRLAGVP